MITATAFILPLVGLIFLILGLLLMFRSRLNSSTAVSRRTYSRIGYIFMGIGMLLFVAGWLRLLKWL